MKGFTLAALLLALAGAAAYSQGVTDREAWKQMGLSDPQIDQAGAIYESTQNAIREARVELDVLKAELRRALYQGSTDMKEVERLLRNSMEWEYKLRLAQITRQVELRRLLGDRLYVRLLEEVREHRRAGGRGGPGMNWFGRDEPGPGSSR